MGLVSNQLWRAAASRLISLGGHPDVGPADTGRALGRVLAHTLSEKEVERLASRERELSER